MTRRNARTPVRHCGNSRRGSSIAGPAILHTSSNAPVMILALPEDFMTIAFLPHMVVIVVSL